MQVGRRGRKRQLAVEDEDWGLILSGVGAVAACRQVGITRKSGYRWRAERDCLLPLRLAETDRGSRYLSVFERQRIATLRPMPVDPGDRGPARPVGLDGEA